MTSKLREARFAPALLGIALALGGALAVNAHYGFPPIGIDDANITFVYARNLAAGQGLVFTPGFERVEGFTSAAWTAICALAFALHPAPERGIALLSLGLSAAALGAAFAAAARLARAAAPDTRGAAATSLALAALWVVGLPRFFAWGTASLMESPLWSWLDAAAAAALVRLALAGSGAELRRASRMLAVSGAGLLVTRPESLALVPALAAIAGLLVLRHPHARSAGAAALARAAGLWLLVAASLTGARMSYFGHLFPNTYYAKVSPDRWWGAQQGLLYLRGYFEQTPAAALLAGIALAFIAGLVWREWRSARGGAAAPSPAARASAAVAAFVWVSLLLPLGGGGDHFSSYRFFQVSAPLLVVPLLGLAARAAGNARGRRFVAIVALGLAASAAHEWRSFLLEDRLDYGFRQAEAGRHKAEAIHSHFAPAPPPSLAAIATGGLGFAYAGRVIDLMGLNWTAMAHSPGDRKGPRDHAAFDPEVFWTEPAEIVSPDLARAAPADACSLYRPWDLGVLQNLYLTPRFTETYRPGTIAMKGGLLSGFFRTDWLATRPAGEVTLLAGTPEECLRRLQRALHVASRATAKSALLIVIDTLGMKHVSFDARGHTPQLAALARNSVVLSNANSTAPWTQPSVATLLTGLLPAEHGVRVLGGILPEERDTLAEMLEARGLDTAAFVSHELLSSNYGFAQGFAHYDASHLGGHTGVTGASVTDAAIAWLESRDAQRPFFLLVHYFDPHYSYQHHPEFSLTDGYRGPLTPGIGIEKLLGLRASLTRADIDYLIGLHREEAAYTDAQIARLLAHLDVAGLADETLVVVTADHGEEFMERGWIGHTRTLYQELLHVPLLFRHPALTPRLLDTPVSLLDVAPTIGELLGVAFPETPLGGRSFARALRNPKVPLPERPIIADVTYLPRVPGNEQAELLRAVKASVRVGSLELIHDLETGRRELYDLATDPAEGRDLGADDPRARGLAESLRRYEEIGGHAGAAQVKSLVEEEARRLEALGYAH